MPHKSITLFNPAIVSTVCTAVLLCVVKLWFLQHQTAAVEMVCAVACRCYDNTANCSQKSIGYIPPWNTFNMSLLELDLSGNTIESLNKSCVIGYNTVRNMSFRNNQINYVHDLAFQGLDNSLIYLDLSSNLIHTIDSTTFSYTPKLQVLLIFNNTIAVLQNALFAELGELRHLDVSYNHISQVPDSAFETNWQLDFLSLRHNYIDSVSAITFRAQLNLKYLDLSHNKISVIVQDAFFALQKLEWLSLAQNRIKTVSTDLCESFQNVLHLNLSDNAIDSNNQLLFSQCSQLQTLSIAHNHLSALPQLAVYGLFNLTHLDLSQNNLTKFGPELFAVPNTSTTQLFAVPNTSTTQMLAVPNTSTTQLPTHNSACPQYQSLYRHLKLLKLNNNRITSLDRCVFAPISSLQTVDVAANSLSALDYMIFLPLENCSSFDISWNRLSTLDDQTARWLLNRGNGTAVNLTGNPWHCDCDRMYTVYRMFRDEEERNITLWCDSPAKLKGRSWDVLEDSCKATVAPTQPAVTNSTDNITAVSTAVSTDNSTAVNTDKSTPVCPDNSTAVCIDNSTAFCTDNNTAVCADNSTAVCTDNSTAVCTSQSVKGNSTLPTVQPVEPEQETSQDGTFSPLISLLISVACFAAVVFIAVVVISIINRRLRSPTLNDLWWEDVVSRKELLSK